MLAIGMVASFLTGNLTVAFILGALFNVPLVFAVVADVILPTRPALAVKQWSISEQFADFGRGVISLSSVAYFVAIMLVMLYLSMVLIGRRHWVRKLGGAMAGHYVFRAGSLVVIAVGVVLLCQRHELRHDVTSEKLSSLAPETKQLLADLQTDRTVTIEAFISPTVPEAYVQTRLNLLTVLREMEAIGGGKVQVRVIPTEQFSEEAARAEQRFGITPARGGHAIARRRERRSHLPGRGRPVRAESGGRAVHRPRHPRRIRTGPLDLHRRRKEAQEGRRPRDRRPALRPLQHAEHVAGPQLADHRRAGKTVRSGPGRRHAADHLKACDVLLAVQPSSLGPEQMDNFVRAVRAGSRRRSSRTPRRCSPATCPPPAPPAPARRHEPMMMQQQPPPKGDIGKLWNLLGVDFSADTIVWQDYNPYPKASQFPKEFVFVDAGSGAEEPFNPEEPISSGLAAGAVPVPRLDHQAEHVGAGVDAAGARRARRRARSATRTCSR